MRAYLRLILPALLSATLLTGCITIHHHAAPRDPLLEKRLALLDEQLSGSPAGVSEQSPEARIAALERQLAESVAALQALQNQRTDGDTPALAAPTPAEGADTVAPVPSALLLKRTDEFQAGKFNMMERYFGRRAKVKFASNEAPKESLVRKDLLGKPLPQTRFLGPDGRIVNLDDFKGHKRVVLVVLRGFPGYVCIGCSLYTMALADAQKDFAEENAQVVLVYPGEADSVAAFLDAIRNLSPDFVLPFPVLLDVNLRAVNALGIKDDLAQPATIIVDEDGIVRYAVAGNWADERPPVPVVLEELRSLSPSVAQDRPEHPRVPERSR